nr:immunoglobulin light chain junction region [Macaca mulatta]
CQQHTSYPPTF